MAEGWGRTLWSLVLVFAPLSVLSFGGGGAILADIEHQAVQVHRWVGPREFADLFAISRAAPGPGTMLSALVGFEAAGLGGALVASAALYAPSCVLTFFVSRLWGRWRGSMWHAAVERGLQPIAAGLVLSGGIAVLRAAPAGALFWVATGVATAVMYRWPRLHPLIPFAFGGCLFALLRLW
jgi:chromate transporter